MTVTSKIQSKERENIPILKVLERTLKKQRGYIYRMPQPGSAVILLLSGGIDSIIIWALLLQRYKLRVYPVFLIRGERKEDKKEEDAIDYYSAIFHRKYRLNYVPPHKLKIHMPEFSDPYRDLIGYLHPDVLLENLERDGSLKRSFNLGHFSVFPFMGFLYAKFLKAHKNIDAKTIFSGATFSDTSSYRTLTSARSVTLTLSLLSGEDNWQYASIAYEPTANSFLTKSDLIRWATKEGIILDNTWTCMWRKKHQCGECLACMSRINAFKAAGVVDTTSYGNLNSVPSVVRKLFGKARRLFSPVKAQPGQKISIKSKKYTPPRISKIFLKV